MMVEELYTWILREDSLPKGFYRYEKKGLINKMPHIKVEDSVIILLEKDSPCLREYLERWSKKVDYRTFRVILEKDQLEELKSSVEKV